MELPHSYYYLQMEEEVEGFCLLRPSARQVDERGESFPGEKQMCEGGMLEGRWWLEKEDVIRGEG